MTKHKPTLLTESLALAMRGGLQTGTQLGRAHQFVAEELVEYPTGSHWFVVEHPVRGFDVAEYDDREGWDLVGGPPTMILCMFGDPKLPVCWEV